MRSFTTTTRQFFTISSAAVLAIAAMLGAAAAAAGCSSSTKSEPGPADAANGGDDAALPVGEDGGTNGSDAQKPAEPIVAFDGELGESIPEWKDGAPDPLVMLVHQSAANTWYISGVEVEADGKVGGVSADRIVAWRFPAGTFELAYDGARSDAKVQNWNSASPAPLLIWTRDDAAKTWTYGTATIAGDGKLAVPTGARVVVWRATPMASKELYAGPAKDAKITGWMAQTPKPIILFAARNNEDTWYAITGGVGPDGSLTNVLLANARAWGF